MPAPKVRDVRKLADSRAVFELDIPVDELPGFPTALGAGGGPLHVRLSFGREQGFAMVQVELQAELAATCQRCLGPMRLRVNTTSPVLIVESEQEADRAPAGWETFLAPEGRLVFAALAAEELLLALPIVPLHTDAAECEALRSRASAAPAQSVATVPGAEVPPGASAGETATTRPFADLRALLERAAKNH
jgi:uncharacterized protein